MIAQSLRSFASLLLGLPPRGWLLRNIPSYWAYPKPFKTSALLMFCFFVPICLNKPSLRSLDTNPCLFLIASYYHSQCFISATLWRLFGRYRHKKAHTVRVGFVTASGFKPETPSSVVRYSIQLSYAAIPFSNLSQKGLQIYLKILFFQRFCLFY